MAQQDNSDLDGIIDATIGIAAERAAIKREMKQALLENRLRDALLHACRLTGIEPTDAVKSFQDPKTTPR
jgi:hypothetical protein